MKQFACATVVEGCDGVVTGATEEEVRPPPPPMPPSPWDERCAAEVVSAIRAGITDA